MHTQGEVIAQECKYQETGALGATLETADHIGLSISFCRMDQWMNLDKWKGRVEIGRGLLLLIHGFHSTLGSQETRALKSLPRFACCFPDWLTSTLTSSSSFTQNQMCAYDTQMGGQFDLQRNKETGELTYWAQSFMNCFQRKGWGNFLIWGKAHFFPLAQLE